MKNNFSCVLGLHFQRCVINAVSDGLLTMCIVVRAIVLKKWEAFRYIGIKRSGGNAPITDAYEREV